MRVEAPQFKRCLCCLPLRYGLLTAGYLKLVLGFLSLSSWISELVSTELKFGPGWYIAIKCFVILIVLADTALTVVFVIGCHKKDAKLLKIYNNFSIGFCVLNIVLFLGAFIYWFVLLAGFAGVLFAAYALRIILILGFFSTCIQVYLILLTRSEILKLEDNTQFSFTNNANEAECAMMQDTEKYVKNPESFDVKLTQPTLTNETEDLEAIGNDDDEVKGPNTLLSKLNGNYAKLN